MLDGNHVTLSRGGKVLLEDATFLIGHGEKVGLVGVNGAGKTTLLRALHGELDPDAGTITRPARVGYLGQDRLADALLAAGAAQHGAAGPATVRDVLLAGRDLAAIAAELRAIEAQLAAGAAPTRWLMDYLARFNGAVLLISHDLALLDRAISRVLHLDATTRTLTAYSGNYTSYQRQRAQAQESAAAQAARQRAKIAQLEEQADWMRVKTAKMARRAKVLDRVVDPLREG